MPKLPKKKKKKKKKLKKVGGRRIKFSFLALERIERDIKEQRRDASPPPPPSPSLPEMRVQIGN